MGSRKIIQVEDKVPFNLLVPLSIQHMFAMFGASVLVPFLFGINPAVVLFMNGVGTLLFMVLTKGKAPAYLGSSFAFIAPAQLVIQQMGYEKTKQAFQESLDNLGLQYLDLYLIHMPFGDYYGSWKALEELYREGKVRAIGVCNFLPDRLLDLYYNAEITPQIDQIERHPHYQRKEDLEIMDELNVQPQAWAPFAEGLKGMFDEPILKEIAEKYDKTVAQIILRWNVQQGVIVIPKSVHRERMQENLDIWNFKLENADMERIGLLDKNCPSMLDTRKVSEVKRVYDYLNNPVLTSL